MTISADPKFIDGAVAPGEGIALLRQVTNARNHAFWPDNLDVANSDEIPQSLLLGHWQVTDAYLLGLAIHHQGKLATLDSGIKALLPSTEV